MFYSSTLQSVTDPYYSTDSIVDFLVIQYLHFGLNEKEKTICWDSELTFKSQGVSALFKTCFLVMCSQFLISVYIIGAHKWHLTRSYSPWKPSVMFFVKTCLYKLLIKSDICLILTSMNFKFILLWNQVYWKSLADNSFAPPWEIFLYCCNSGLVQNPCNF